ncbi:MAG: hypothetical protein ACEQSR_01545 [Candidatus Methylacidiphilales bacterium]|jgi:predicted transcriptional regulator
MKEVQRDRIEVSPSMKKKIAEELNVTPQTVRNALKYFTNSEDAIAIRTKAIELLQAEAAKAGVIVTNN